MFPGLLDVWLSDVGHIVGLFATPEFDGGSFTGISRYSDTASYNAGLLRSTSIY